MCILLLALLKMNRWLEDDSSTAKVSGGFVELFFFEVEGAAAAGTMFKLFFVDCSCVRIAR
jgi:hypothetical protein